jgi:hypothetical protein
MPGSPNNQNASKPADQKLSSFLYIRALPADKAGWVKAAGRAKQTLSEWATIALNQAAAKRP